jgi:hypothetical protein
MELLPINEDNFTPAELEILAKDISQFSNEEFNRLSFQVRAHLMSKQIVKNQNEGWEEKRLKNQSK